MTQSVYCWSLVNFFSNQNAIASERRTRADEKRLEWPLRLDNSGIALFGPQRETKKTFSCYLLTPLKFDRFVHLTEGRRRGRVRLRC